MDNYRQTQPTPPLRDSYEGILARARHADRVNDVKGAIELYRRLIGRLAGLSDRVLSRRPDLLSLQVLARIELGELLANEGRYAEAIEVEQPLLELDPEQADQWRQDLAILRIAKGEVDAGLADLRALAEEKPDDPWGWTILSIQSRIEGRFAESQAALDRALEIRGESEPLKQAALHYERFELFKAMGRLDEALAAWEQAVALDATLSSTVRNVYTMLTNVGRYSEAQRYVARDDNPLQAGFQRGLIAYLTGDWAKAKQEWQAVARLDPDKFEAGHECWVEAVLRLGDPVPALERLPKILTEYATPRLVVLWGIAWAMNRDPETAAMLFQQAIYALRHGRPPRQKLDGADWHLLASLVSDEKIKAGLKPYFAVVETLWGR